MVLVLYQDGLSVCLQKVTHPRSNHLILTQPGLLIVSLTPYRHSTEPSADYITVKLDLQNVAHVVRYSFRPVSTTETAAAEASSEDELTEKILLGRCNYLTV